ncbi:hypothetical protein [Demequina lutea]|uniref:Heavy metal transporter n=1 Tax=Demequina lutea TaxID=431489 RepID=A0A7Y9ZBC8_9MICO|nr:hypothetical protein [Demequina lutea]NYI42262.1 hypothetical protein [Demequina lutea]
MARTGGVIATAAFLGVATVAVLWGPALYSSFTASPPSNQCTVSTPIAHYSRSAERTDNVAIIAAVGWVNGFDEKGVTIAVTTAIQESGLRNLNYGDRDSVGLFQQRASQGWGTVEQIMDARYSATMFYTALGKVNGWENLRVTEAAQAVQRSGFPEAYASHEAEGRAWANALGGVEGTVSCELTAPDVTTARAFSDRVALDFPGAGFAVEVLESDGNTTVLGIKPTDATDQSLRRLQSWAIATASTTGAEWADLRGSRWTRNGTWQQSNPTQQWANYPGIRVAVRTS